MRHPDFPGRNVMTGGPAPLKKTDEELILMSFTTCCPEHPEVLRCLRTGYPNREEKDAPVCDICGCGLYDTVFIVEGDNLCPECFLEWLEDYMRTNTEDVADALGVDWYREARD